MVKNEVLNYIIKSVQQGDFERGQPFFSSKQLSIKFNCSPSKTKHALHIAESAGFLKSQDIGKKYIVQDFGKRIFSDTYMKNEFYEKSFYIKVSDSKITLPDEIEELKLDDLNIDNTFVSVYRNTNPSTSLTAAKLFIEVEDDEFKEEIEKGHYVTVALKNMDILISDSVLNISSKEIDGKLMIIVKTTILSFDKVIFRTVTFIDPNFFDYSRVTRFPVKKEAK